MGVKEHSFAELQTDQRTATASDSGCDPTHTYLTIAATRSRTESSTGKSTTTFHPKSSTLSSPLVPAWGRLSTKCWSGRALPGAHLGRQAAGKKSSDKAVAVVSRSLARMLIAYINAGGKKRNPVWKFYKNTPKQFYIHLKEEGIRKGTWLIVQLIIDVCSLSLNTLSPRRRSSSTSGKDQGTSRLLFFLNTLN